jgi:hypothetical protein
VASQLVLSPIAILLYPMVEQWRDSTEAISLISYNMPNALCGQKYMVLLLAQLEHGITLDY